MGKKQKTIVIIISVLIVGLIFILLNSFNSKKGKQINIDPESQQTLEFLNTGPVSPLSGLACDNWNRRPIAVMQPSDVQARPAAGFSEADMVFEMPGYTSSVTRLMGVYLCNIPDEIGAIRSSRHDYIHLAKGLNAIFVHWGGSHFALDLLKENVIDHIACPGNYCGRWDWKNDPIMRMEDSGHITKENVSKAITDLGFKTEANLSGYPHQMEAPLDQRPTSGHLRVAFAKPWDVEYDYDRDSNSYLRIWNDVDDTDRNTGERIAPKNIAVLFAVSEQITNSQDYVGRGLRNPWANVEDIKNTGSESISGRYNNVQIGDPWYDDTDSGEAYYYFNGQEIKGTWKKDRSRIDSKLFFYDSSGKEIKFVPGQIWVEILEPGQRLKWESIQ